MISPQKKKKTNAKKKIRRKKAISATHTHIHIYGEREKKRRIWIPMELDLLHSASAADRWMDVQDHISPARPRTYSYVQMKKNKNKNIYPLSLLPNFAGLLRDSFRTLLYLFIYSHSPPFFLRKQASNYAALHVLGMPIESRCSRDPQSFQKQASTDLAFAKP